MRLGRGLERADVFLSRHLWAQLTLSVLAGCALTMLIFPGPSALSVLVRTAFTSVAGIAVVVAVRRREKRAAGGSAGELVTLDRALRAGEVPTDPAERERMRELVGQRLHRTRHRVAALVVFAVLFCAVTASVALTSGVRQAVGMALLTVAFLGWSVANSNLQNRRLLTMRAALEADGPATSAPPTAEPPPRLGEERTGRRPTPHFPAEGRNG
ncbi:hypothetical protein ABZT03_11880 [Streptomyces sp. NPDC005574]|uniref:hypothetical protein n=1 Tax=Streptomyces sp. NPDC005574 TaxID=3156891 RepID=UPI0033A1F5F4